MVGFPTTDNRKIGQIKEGKYIEEGIVVIPFKTVNNQREFFKAEDAGQLTYQSLLLDKYLFPPTFDFVTNPTVDPVLFYAFEFGLTLDQDDLAKIWQNLPPKSNSAFQKSTVAITIISFSPYCCKHRR